LTKFQHDIAYYKRSILDFLAVTGVAVKINSMLIKAERAGLTSCAWEVAMPGNTAFSMTIEDVFFIRGRGTVVTGVISDGTLSVGDVVLLNGIHYVGPIRVVGIEVFRRRKNSVSAGERVGVVLEGIRKDEVSRGDMLESGDPNFTHD
jgi:translation elongation factor EF-Tu-like GTPase